MKKDRSSRIVKNTVKLFEELRQTKDLSQEDLARLSGVTRPAVSHIESGRRKPSLQMSLKLAEALETRLSDIIRNAEDDS